MDMRNATIYEMFKLLQWKVDAYTKETWTRCMEEDSETFTMKEIAEMLADCRRTMDGIYEFVACEFDY